MEAQKRSARKVRDLRAKLGLAAPSTPSSSVNPFQWTFIGPQPITDTNGSNTYSGSILSVALDAHNTSTIYAVTYEGKLWKTTDGGIEWHPLLDSGPLTFVRSAAVDPAIPNTVYAQEDTGIYKSADGGTTWTNLPPLESDQSQSCGIESFAIHPSITGTWLAQTYCYNYGTSSYTSILYRSSDGGGTWSKVLTKNNFLSGSLQFNSGDGKYAYVVNIPTGVSPTVALDFEVSNDCGITWTARNGSGGSALPALSAATVSLAASPTAPNTIYIEVQSGPFGQEASLLFKTTDGGAHWGPLASLPPDLGDPRTPSLVAVSPKTPDLVFAGGVSFYRSLDGGTTWQAAACGASGICLHSDHHAMVFTPDGSRAYESNDGGIWTTTSFASPEISWTSLNTRLGTVEVYDISIDPTNLNRGFAGTQDNGTLLYNGSLAWPHAGVCGDGFQTAIDPSNPNVVYAACNSEVLKSTAGGVPGTWSSITGGLPDVTFLNFARLVLDDSTSRVLYVYDLSPASSLFQTLDAGASLHQIGPAYDEGVLAVKAAPSDSNTVYVVSVASLTCFPSAFRLWVSSNALSGSRSTWTAHNFPNVDLGCTTLTFDVDPAQPRHGYATVSSDHQGGFLISTVDGGVSWQTIYSFDSGIGFINSFVIDPDVPNTLYAGSFNSALLRSSDGGASWYPLATDLPIVPVADLKLHRASRTLRASAYGRGLWDLSVPTTAPRLTNLSISTAAANGSGYVLTVNGVNFDANSIMRLNGANLTTTLVSATQLTAVLIPTAPTSGTNYVAVYEPGLAGGLSDPLPLVLGLTISADALVNAAIPASSTTVLAAGSLATLFGTQLAPQQAAAAPPYPTTLRGVTVFVNGVAAPLVFISPNQINFVVPWELAGHSHATVIVNVDGSLSNSVGAQVAPTAPGVFTVNAAGQGAVLIAGTSSLAAPDGAFPGSRPVKNSESIEIFATGLGAVSNQPADGQPPSGLASTRQTVAAAVGCTNGGSFMCDVASSGGSIEFAGLAPGFVGLYQVNLLLPPNAAPGPAVPLQLSIGGHVSNTVTIAID